MCLVSNVIFIIIYILNHFIASYDMSLVHYRQLEKNPEKRIEWNGTEPI